MEPSWPILGPNMTPKWSQNRPKTHPQTTKFLTLILMFFSTANHQQPSTNIRQLTTNNQQDTRDTTWPGSLRETIKFAGPLAQGMLDPEHEGLLVFECLRKKEVPPFIPPRWT